MWAADYVNLYHTIEVPEFAPSPTAKLWGSGAVRTPIKEYLNGSHSQNYAGTSRHDQIAFKDTILNFFNARAKEADSGITYDGGYTLMCSSKPFVSLAKSRVMSCFSGKASVDSLTKTIQLISYWRGWQIHIKGKSMEALPALVERYLGEDCNGFVGNYIKEKYPSVGFGNQSPEEFVENLGRKSTGKTRKNCLELQDDDIIVFSGHIAVIDTVLLSTEDEAYCTVSEAKNDKVKNGGPQTNNHTIRLSKKNKSGFSMPDHSLTPKWIGRVEGM